MRRRLLFVAVFAALGLFAAACGDDGGSGSEGASGASAPGADGTADQPDPGTAEASEPGGVLKLAQFTPTTGLDPALSAGSGSVGGTELAALYDTIVWYNPETGGYEPRTAESLEPNDDFTVWTLKLEPDITFADGTDYDADAVKFVLDRQMTEGYGVPRGQLNGVIDDITVVDSLTLRFDLKLGWAGFPYLLSGVSGMIYSPTQFQAVGDPAEFNVNPGPAGAGPFRLVSFTPGERIVMERNPDYYGGDVLLDGIEFSYLGGSDQTYEFILSGDVHGGWFNQPPVAAQAEADGLVVNQTTAIAGNIIMMNSGVDVACAGGQPATLCEGKPDGETVPVDTATRDIRVRRAVVAAVDPSVVNERAYEDTASPSSAPFAGSPWDPDIDGPSHDPEEARRLVDEAKADGWDGTIRVLASNTQDGRNWAGAVSSQLEAVGMDVEVDTTKDTGLIVKQVIVEHDFDLVTWSVAMLADADAPYLALSASFDSETQRYGYGNEEFDAAVDLLRTAQTDEEREAANAAITELWVRDAPAHVITSLGQGLIHRSDLHDVKRNGFATYHFDEAWLSR